MFLQWWFSKCGPGPTGGTQRHGRWDDKREDIFKVMMSRLHLVSWCYLLWFVGVSSIHLNVICQDLCWGGGGRWRLIIPTTSKNDQKSLRTTAPLQWVWDCISFYSLYVYLTFGGDENRCHFWQNTPEDFHHLYENTSYHMHGVKPYLFLN